ncbi:hypothetical protein E2C01_016145 [Portunus trituberculatus]|uniref:Uncharacterized protein n=1 Tax=Portunus trituberculatus TaxID=210409 RepID=A0A5B7DNT2_PORTR|nr:hypothetical protein [Portunus trituberculatus]
MEPMPPAALLPPLLSPPTTKMDWHLDLRLRHLANIPSPETTCIDNVITFYHALASFYSHHSLILNHYSRQHHNIFAPAQHSQVIKDRGSHHAPTTHHNLGLLRGKII